MSINPEYRTLGRLLEPQPTGISPDFNREAIARLVGACESIIERGLLDADEEFALRTLTNSVCTAFDMAPVQDSFERDLNTIREVMERK